MKTKHSFRNGNLYSNSKQHFDQQNISKKPNIYTFFDPILGQKFLNQNTANLSLIEQKA